MTGAGRGIGRAIALICSNEGAKVAITSRSQSELEETSSKMKEPAAHIQVADITDQEQVESMVSSVHKAFGGIDLLINNAGGAQPEKGPAEALKSDDLTNLLGLNVVSVHRVTSAVLNQNLLSKGGQIINISSKAGKVGLPNMSLYVASKFALEGLTASWAAEMKDKGIKVNSISPGMVDTKSFPKAPGKAGVRTAESIKDGLFVLIESEKTGHYLHVDELDQVREKGLDDSMAMKPINELPFSV